MTYDTKLFNDKIFKIRATTVAPVAVSNLGDIRYADGTGWDPGFGEGYYFWNGDQWIPMFGTAIYDLEYFGSGAPTGSEIMLPVTFVRTVTFPTDLVGSYGKLLTATTAAKSFDLQKNGVSFGTMSFGAAATTATFSVTQTTFSAGDVFKCIAPVSADATLAGLYFSFKLKI